MDGVVLAEIESEKDLGVYITKESKPSTQCTKAAQKAMKLHTSNQEKHSSTSTMIPSRPSIEHTFDPT